MAFEEPRWIVGPPGAGRGYLRIAVDHQVTLTPALRRALDGLLQTVHDGEARSVPGCPFMDMTSLVEGPMLTVDVIDLMEGFGDLRAGRDRRHH